MGEGGPHCFNRSCCCPCTVQGLGSQFCSGTLGRYFCCNLLPSNWQRGRAFDETFYRGLLDCIGYGSADWAYSDLRQVSVVTLDDSIEVLTLNHVRWLTYEIWAVP